jgi:hypothetical protein
MAGRTTGGGSAPRNEGDGDASWWSWLEQRPIGQFAVGVVLIGWTALAILTSTGFWSLEVAFCLAIALLTLVLGCLSLYAAVMQARRPMSSVLRPPNRLLDFEDYFRWLTPVAFFFGLVFAHYFWH